jgi:Fe-S-cluster containining protein
MMVVSDIPLALWPPAVGRACGSCSMCCGPAMSIKAVNKRFGEWCQHCKPGNGGCGIYETRPEVCRTFACSWVRGMLPDELHPMKVNAVVADYHGAPGNDEIVIWLDPGFPDAHQHEPLKTWIAAAVRFARVKLVHGDQSYIARPDASGSPSRNPE